MCIYGNEINSNLIINTYITSPTTLDWKHSQYQKTVPDMRLPPPSNLLISGLEFIEK